MRPITPGTAIMASYGTALTPGTVTSTSVDWSPVYEPDFTYIANCGAISSGGTIVAHVQGSNASASNFTSLGSATFADVAGGTTTKVVDVDAGTAVYRYYRSLITAVGGTATGGVSAVFYGKPRTTSS